MINTKTWIRSAGLLSRERLRRLGYTIILFVTLSACNTNIATNSDDPRPCQTNGSSAWTELQFEAVINKPEECPIPLDVESQQIPLQGQVTTPRSATFDAWGDVTLLNAREQLITEFDLNYSLDFNTDKLIANISETYFAGSVKEPALVDRFRDTALFVTTVFPEDPDSDITDVTGGVDLPYTHDPQVELNGSGSVALGGEYTVSSWSRNGLLPLSTKWFLDGVFVGTGDSYTGVGSSPGLYTLVAEKTDAEGDVGNQSMTIYVQETTEDGCLQEPC